MKNATRRISTYLLGVTCLTTLFSTGCSLSVNGRPFASISMPGMPGMPGAPGMPPMPGGPGMDPSQMAGQPGQPLGVQVPDVNVNIGNGNPAAAPGSPLAGQVAGQFQPPAQPAAPNGQLLPASSTLTGQPAGTAPGSPQSVAVAAPGTPGVVDPSSVPAGNNPGTPPPVPTAT